MKNKRSKITNLFKIGILLFGVSLLLWNCEREDVLEIEKKEFIIKEHSLEDLKIKTKFTSILKLLESRKVASSKNVNSTDIYNFTIVPNNIKEVTLEDITSYTLLVKRPFSTPYYFENLVIQLKEGEETKAYIIKYTPNNTVKLFDEHNSFNYEGKSTVFHLNLNNLDIFSKGTTGECPPILQTWCSWQYDHIAGPTCYEANDGRLFRKYVEDENCTETGYISSSGGGSSEGETSDPILTSPINEDGTPIKFNEGEITADYINGKLDGSLNLEQMKWLETHIPEAKEIQNFLLVNTSLEAKTFGYQALMALMNNGEVDFEDRIINELIGDAKCIFKKLKTLNLYKGTIKQFENSDYDLIITYGACNSGEACTNDDFIDLGIIEIKVSGLNNTHLGFAATLLHEGIHAELFKYVHERNRGVDVNDRPNLMYHYFQLKGEVDPRYLDARVQHEHMADKYVRPIAEAIRELDNNRYPLDYYWGFAWDGLRPYGFNQYLDSNGNYIELDDTGFVQKQTLVNSTSPFNSQTFDQNCN